MNGVEPYIMVENNRYNLRQSDLRLPRLLNGVLMPAATNLQPLGVVGAHRPFDRSATTSKVSFPESDWFSSLSGSVEDEREAGLTTSLDAALLGFLDGIEGIPEALFISDEFTIEFFLILRDIDRYVRSSAMGVDAGSIDSALPTYAQLVASERLIKLDAIAIGIETQRVEDWLAKILKKVLAALGLEALAELALIVVEVCKTELSNVRNATTFAARMSAVKALLKKIGSKAFVDIVQARLGPRVTELLKKALGRALGGVFSIAIFAAALAGAIFNQAVFA